MRFYAILGVLCSARLALAVPTVIAHETFLNVDASVPFGPVTIFVPRRLDPSRINVVVAPHADLVNGCGTYVTYQGPFSDPHNVAVNVSWNGGVNGGFGYSGVFLPGVGFPIVLAPVTCGVPSTGHYDLYIVLERL
jgi:hypothetical protein